jgi:hypothetical protein
MARFTYTEPFRVAFARDFDILICHVLDLSVRASARAEVVGGVPQDRYSATASSISYTPKSNGPS